MDYKEQKFLIFILLLLSEYLQKEENFPKNKQAKKT